MVISSNLVAPCLCFQVADILIVTDEKKTSANIFGKLKNKQTLKTFLCRFGGKERRYEDNSALSKTNKVKSLFTYVKLSTR